MSQFLPRKIKNPQMRRCDNVAELQMQMPTSSIEPRQCGLPMALGSLRLGPTRPTELKKNEKK